MTCDRIPVLWLCGPPGVGKTMVAWEIYTRLTRDGVALGYVDIDQLGICYQEPTSDPERHRMKAANLAAVVDGFRMSGAGGVIVSGVTDPIVGPPADLIPETKLTLCRMRVGRAELAERLVDRGDGADQVADALDEADTLDASDFADLCVDTNGLSVAGVVRLVMDRTDGWPAPTSLDRSSTPGRSVRTVEGTILWLCGPTGVGKSTIGWTIFQRTLAAGVPAAYINLDQIGFRNPVPADDPRNDRLKARNLAAIWETYHAAGAQHLVMVGPATDEAAIGIYGDALPAATLTVCRLHAERDQLTRRIITRGQGGSWPRPGDPLKGRPTSGLRQVAERAASDGEALERAAIGDLRIDTDGLSVEEAASAIISRTRWPHEPPDTPNGPRADRSVVRRPVCSPER